MCADWDQMMVEVKWKEGIIPQEEEEEEEQGVSDLQLQAVSRRRRVYRCLDCDEGEMEGKDFGGKMEHGQHHECVGGGVCVCVRGVKGSTLCCGDAEGVS